MLNATNTHSLLGQSKFAVALVRPDGGLLYENRPATALFKSSRSAVGSISDSFTIPSTWTDVVVRLTENDTVADEPVLMKTSNAEDELCFLSIIPQRNAEGGLDSLLCIWAARRNALADNPAAEDGEGLNEYTRDLEAILEHRTYRQMIQGELLEQSRKALDIISVGILIVDTGGNILYYNNALSDSFAFRRSDLAEPHIRYMLSPESLAHFERVLRTGFRECADALDASGSAINLEFLPVIEHDEVTAIVIQFSHALVATPAF